MASLERLPVSHYDTTRVPDKIARFGPALNDYRTSSGRLDENRYWPAAEEARRIWATARLRPDPVQQALQLLGNAWGQAVAPATIRGRTVFGGTVREITGGALVHCDEVAREYPDQIFDQRITSQLAFNVWVAVPHSGGETQVWRRRWQPQDEAHRQAYGYTPQPTTGHQELRLAPQLGEGLLFNPAHLHAVRPCEGQRRAAFAFFLGLTSAGQLIYWS